MTNAQSRTEWRSVGRRGGKEGRKRGVCVCWGGGGAESGDEDGGRSGGGGGKKGCHQLCFVFRDWPEVRPRSQIELNIF